MVTDETPDGAAAPKKKRTRKPKPAQPELKGIKVATDKVGKAARRFREAIEAHDIAVTEKKNATNHFVKVMIEENRPSITIDGYTFKHTHKDAEDKILVKRPNKNH